MVMELGVITFPKHRVKTEYVFSNETQEEVLTDILDGGSCNPEGTGFDQSYLVQILVPMQVVFG